MFVLSERDVEKVVSIYGADYVMDRLIEGIHNGFKSMAEGSVVHSPRVGFAHNNNLIEWMPVKRNTGEVVVKIVSYFPENPERYGIPTIGAIVARTDCIDGQIVEVAECRLLTAMRTGAASAVSTRLCGANHSSTLGLIGCGAQAVTQAHALSRILPLRKVIAFDIDPAAVSSLAKRLAFLRLTIVAAEPDEIGRLSDVICTTTTIPVGASPVFGDRELLSHVHINAVGSDFPGKTELPPALVQSAFVVADSLEQARVEGECQSLSDMQIASSRVVELQAVVREPITFEHLRDERTIFDSTGIAMEDAVALQLICKLARQSGFGRELDSSESKCDAKDPYGRIVQAQLARNQFAPLQGGLDAVERGEPFEALRPSSK